jgi:dolichyl-phosphate beta-glucosyltransferase
MPNDSVRLSVVIPAFNEERRVGGTLEELKDYLDRQPYDYEIVVVDDGSTDGTTRIMQHDFPAANLVTYAQNRGKGYAMRRGVPVSVGEYVLVYDADGSTPIEDVEKVWPLMEAGADVVIGSRALPESDVRVRQPLYRQSMGRMFNVILRVLRLTSYKDTQCGFKCIRRTCAEAVFPKLTVDGFGADCEMLYVAHLLGYRIEEIPVCWINSPDSRVNAFWDSLDMFREVVTVRWRSLLGAYR